MNKNYVYIGAPGTGKGTHGEKLAKEFNLLHISTGEIFRTEMKNKTELGIEINDIMVSGGLVSDELTNRVVLNRLSQEDCKNGFILDGYPRTMNQVKFLEKSDIVIDNIVVFEVGYDTSVDRLIMRARGDQGNAVISKRFSDFETLTQPVIDFYKTKQNTVVLNTSFEIGIVYDNLKNLLGLNGYERLEDLVMELAKEESIYITVIKYHKLVSQGTPKEVLTNLSQLGRDAQVRFTEDRGQWVQDGVKYKQSINIDIRFSDEQRKQINKTRETND